VVTCAKMLDRSIEDRAWMPEIQSKRGKYRSQEGKSIATLKIDFGCETNNSTSRTSELINWLRRINNHASSFFRTRPCRSLWRCQSGWILFAAAAEKYDGDEQGGGFCETDKQCRSIFTTSPFRFSSTELLDKFEGSTILSDSRSVNPGNGVAREALRGSHSEKTHNKVQICLSQRKPPPENAAWRRWPKYNQRAP